MKSGLDNCVACPKSASPLALIKEISFNLIWLRTAVPQVVMCCMHNSLQDSAVAWVQPWFPSPFSLLAYFPSLSILLHVQASVQCFSSFSLNPYRCFLPCSMQITISNPQSWLRSSRPPESTARPRERTHFRMPEKSFLKGFADRNCLAYKCQLQLKSESLRRFLP